MNFDFDEWVKLAQDDPEAFERRRKAEIEAVINAASQESQERLRGLQWKIDMERAKASTPLAALVKIQGMMWDSFHKLNDKLQELCGDQSVTPAQPREAKVLNFRKTNG